MNYVFLDTCCWIDFASGKNHQSKHDFTDSNWRKLESMLELKNSKEIVLLKNEIIDLEFKTASISPFIEAYDTRVLSQIRSSLETKIIVHCEDSKMRNSLRETLMNLDELLNTFRNKSTEYNKRVWSLFNEAVHINVSESIKQKALNYAINKNHALFESSKNNVNDFLILYSIQEWIQSYKELRDLDETSQEHTIYFVTKNIKEFGTGKENGFKKELGISQLIKPIWNLDELISKVKTKKYESQDFLPNYSFSETSETPPLSPKEEVVNKLHDLIKLKREFLTAFIKKKIKQIDFYTRLKYIGKLIPSNYNNSKLNLQTIRTQNIINGNLQIETIMTSSSVELLTLSRQGDILIPSMGAKAGEHCINNLPFKITVHPSIYVFRIEENKLNGIYLNYAMNGIEINPVRDKIGMQRLSVSELLNIQIRLPPIERQNNLVALFQEKEKEIEEDVLKIKAKIKMMLQ